MRAVAAQVRAIDLQCAVRPETMDQLIPPGWFWALGPAADNGEASARVIARLATMPSAVRMFAVLVGVRRAPALMACQIFSGVAGMSIVADAEMGECIDDGIDGRAEGRRRAAFTARAHAEGVRR